MRSSGLKDPRVILFVLFFLPLKIFCQAQAGLERISAYGKVWGVVNYFHPEMGKGHINGDSLFLLHADGLIADATAIHFKQSITELLRDLHDPRSVIVDSADLPLSGKAVARTAFGSQPLPSKQLYLALPQEVFGKEFNTDSILTHSPYENVIVDLRCSESNNTFGLRQYKLFVQPLVAGMIKRAMELPTERSFFYKGLMRQDFPSDLNLFDPDKYGNVDHLQVHAGLRNISDGAYLLSGESRKYSTYRYCFIINRSTNINSVKALMALRNRGQCIIVFDGPVPEYLYGSFYYMNLPDRMTAKIRISEVIYENGSLGCKPDLVMETVSDTSVGSMIIQRASRLLKTTLFRPNRAPIENTVFIRKPSNVSSAIGVPDTKFRLLGLFNFWNAIYYFSPNKNLISVNWEAILPYYVDKFLIADTEEKYFLALMELTASIKDGHGILINKKSGRSPKGVFDGNLPFACEQIDNKVYVTSIMPDSMQRESLSKLKYGDVVIAIDGIPVAEIIKKWEPLLVASNTAGFRRELYATWFTAGVAGSVATIAVARDGHPDTIILRRIHRDEYYSLWGKVKRPVTIDPVFPPNCRILDGNIGYLRMNRIYTNQLDSIANLLKGCRDIIIDARGYPRDGSIGSNLASYIATKVDTVSYDEFPFVTGPDPKKRQMLVDYSIIQPRSNRDLKDKNYYILVDEGNQSQGEWNVIVLQGVTAATTIGRASAGANGMAVTINLPGDYFTFFSGFGEFYMDHTPNQKNGVKIDIIVKRNLRAAINGEDDIFMKALSVVAERARFEDGR